jgi:hypothetical protein
MYDLVYDLVYDLSDYAHRPLVPCLLLCNSLCMQTYQGLAGDEARRGGGQFRLCRAT